MNHATNTELERAAPRAQVFLSYRRGDSAGWASALADRLQAAGIEVVRDEDMLLLSAGFASSLLRAVADCDAVLALIGPDWLRSKDREGVRRLARETDFVRLALEAALQQQVPVLPVLVGDAEPPRPDQFPPALHEIGSAITQREAVSLRPESWNDDVDRLVSLLWSWVPDQAPQPSTPRIERAVEVPPSPPPSVPATAPRGPRAFISYRRTDSLVHARLLALSLEHFVKAEVFLDLDAVAAGKRYRHEYERAVSACDVFFVLIGDRWLAVTDKQGNPRIADEDDHVHKEIRAALEREVPIVPLLIKGAEMPDPEELPPALKELEEWEAKYLRDVTWKQDFDVVAKNLVALWGAG
ncbi:MAG TPA: toll/interleukin-1 receptor domain-containing protein [Thermoleophilaceae bacterium]|nr:toll/interleukin-1 receptor domain-containing protein [Thermoleophilaceae bacterium]